jgi:hypothetical protein
MLSGPLGLKTESDEKGVVRMGTGEKMRLVIFDNPQVFIRIHPALVPRVSLRPDSTCNFTFGTKHTSVPVVVDRQAPMDGVLVSRPLHQQLSPDVDLDFVHVTTENNQVTVGPLIGILCNPVWNAKQGRLKNNNQLPGLQKMAEIGRREGALVYLFGLSSVDFRAHSVTGYVWNGGRWTRTILPLPDVIYDQVISRKIENSKTYLEKRKRLSELYKDRIFNDGFFDKWKVYEWLVGDKRSKPHVPATVRYSGVQSCARFIHAHDVTFLKPVHGSLGLGIIRVTKQGEKSLRYEVKHKNQQEQGVAASPLQLAETLRRRLARRPYVMQQGLRLARYHGCPFDVRIVLQRDGTGEWKRTKMFARVAKEGDFTSNLSSGGEALPVGTILQSFYAKDADRKKARTRMNRVATLVTEVMEAQSGKQFGELGIDIGLDEKGHVWVIEVNSKPWKRPYTEKGRQDLVDLAFTRPMEYAIYLANKR